jgi:hypothetical protein
MPYPTANYTGTHAWPADSILNYVLGQHGTASPALSANVEFLRVGGRHTEQPGSATGTLDIVTWVDERGYVNPHFDAITLFSTTTAGTQTTSTGTTLVGLGAMHHVMVLVDVTATGGTDPTLDCFIDSQFGGTRFINIARTTLMVGPQAALIILDRSPATGGQIASANADAAAGAVRSGGFGDNMRVRYSVGSNATSQVTFAVYVTAIG